MSRAVYVRSMRSALPIRGPLLCLTGPLMALLLTAQAQGDKGSLTDQFPNMSAKERARIAAKENEEAQKDASYQDVMRAAEQSFQEGRYEEAIKQYEQARAMRPYNVYPKVKIEDLRALLARQAASSDSAVVEDHPVDPEPVVAAEGPATRPLPPAEETPVAPGPTLHRQPERTPDPVTEKPVPAVEQVSPGPAAGIIEQRYREGHAFVIERAVTVDGRLVKYKRVYHPYGQVFFFEDGLAVDERVWKARFPDR